MVCPSLIQSSDFPDDVKARATELLSNCGQVFTFDEVLRDAAFELITYFTRLQSCFIIISTGVERKKEKYLFWQQKGNRT